MSLPNTPRSDAIELQVDYKKMNTFFADYTKNISKGGTFIKTGRPLQVGTQFLFKLAIPMLEEKVTLKGEVIWVRSADEAAGKSGPEGEPGMGIRFLYKDTAERRDFESSVEALMKESLGEHIFQHLLHR